MTWRNRIVGHGEEQPEQLLAHPQNFRRHGGPQLEALRGSLRELGWVKGVLVNRTTGRVVDGHARVEEAMRQNAKTIPVDYVELTEDEERLALAVLDPISEMATRDDEALTALLAEVHTEDPGLQALLDEMAGEGAGGENHVSVQADEREKCPTCGQSMPRELPSPIATTGAKSHDATRIRPVQ
jgi:hypothetical protein